LKIAFLLKSNDDIEKNCVLTIEKMRNFLAESKNEPQKIENNVTEQKSINETDEKTTEQQPPPSPFDDEVKAPPVNIYFYLFWF
jgi:hypothetical protein